MFKVKNSTKTLRRKGTRLHLQVEAVQLISFFAWTLPCKPNIPYTTNSNVKRAVTFDFFTMWILNSVDSDEPVQLLLSLGTLN